MIGDDQRDAFIAIDAAAQACDRRFDIEQRRRGALSQRHDDLRLDERNLAVEIRAASLGFERRLLLFAEKKRAL